MADSDDERGEMSIFMPIDYFGNIRNIVKGLKYCCEIN